MTLSEWNKKVTIQEKKLRNRIIKNLISIQKRNEKRLNSLEKRIDKLEVK